jgi:hypothetical protein
VGKGRDALRRDGLPCGLGRRVHVFSRSDARLGVQSEIPRRSR